MKYFQSFRIVGDTNAITYDVGLKSTEAEPKRLVAVHTQIDGYPNVAEADFLTKEADFQGWHERAKVFDIPVKMIPSRISTETAAVLSDPMTKVIPVDIDIPVGEIFMAAIKCADAKVRARGAYEYEIIS